MSWLDQFFGAKTQYPPGTTLPQRGFVAYQGNGVVVTDDAADNRTVVTITSPASTIFGNGVDGAASFDGSSSVLGASKVSSTYTLTRDVYYASANVLTGITVYTAGYRLFCAGTMTVVGTVHNDGLAAATGTGGAHSGLGSMGIGTAGGNGGTNGVGSGGTNQTNGVADAFLVSECIGGNGGAATNAGGASGSYSVVSTGSGSVNWLTPMQTGFMIGQTSSGASAQFYVVGGGSGGGGGGSDNASATGGGGGGGGGVLSMSVYNLTNSGIIRAAGGAGANGSGSAGNAGGGGGGGGGVVLLTTRFFTGAAPTAPGGLGGNGYGTGGAGVSGAAGLVVTGGA